MTLTYADLPFMALRMSADYMKGGGREAFFELIMIHYLLEPL
jgi:hypothetical protein